MSAILSGWNAIAAILGIHIKPHASLLRNVSQLAAGSIANSVLGFVYWSIAARSFSLEAVGLTAAAVSIMSLIALLAQLGLGTVLIGETLSRGEKEAGVVSAVSSISFAAAMLLGFLFLAAAWKIPIDLGHITSSHAGAVCFVLGCGVTSFAMILNSAFIGLLKSSFSMYQEFCFSLCKLAFLILIAAEYGSAANENLLFQAWVIAQVIPAGVFAVRLRTFDAASSLTPRFARLRALMPISFAHHLLDVVILTPLLIMPFLVAVMLSPTVNAAFNAAWMMLRITFLLPASLSTVLFAIGRADRNAFSSRLRISLLFLIATGIGVVIFFSVSSDFLLNIFNPEYPSIAADSLRLLGPSFISAAVLNMYLAIQRLDGRRMLAFYVFATGGLAELFFVCLGAHFYGIVGLALGWTIASALLAAYTAKFVLREAEIFNLKRVLFFKKTHLSAQKAMTQEV